jgi:hypothetical protein
MGSYARPPLRVGQYLDEDGRPIPYGRRWNGSPADDSYSRTSHTERYRGLHDVATAVISYLTRTYDVYRSEDPDEADCPAIPPSLPSGRRVRLTPANPDGAPITVVYTGFPGIAVRAGVLHDWYFPACGCDACDQPPVDAAGDLERLLFAVAAGGFQESAGRGRIEHSLAADGWSNSGWSSVDRGDRTRLDAARRRLAGLTDGWQPWRSTQWPLPEPPIDWVPEP